MRGYTGSHPRRCTFGKRRRTIIAPFASLALVLAAGSTQAVHDSVLQGIVAEYEAKVFTLKVDLRAPERGAIHVPMFDEEGWHFHNPSGPIVLRKGQTVEVTGVFNYSERGFFLELAEESRGFLKDPIQDRARMRLRFMVRALPEEPEEQLTQARELVGEVLETQTVP